LILYDYLIDFIRIKDMLLMRLVIC